MLCWLNPLYAIFGFFGFIDAWDALRKPWVHLGVLVVAITQAGSQSGGLPPESGGQAGLFLALVLVNGGLATVFMKLGLRTEERNTELERLNADLEAALVENEALHDGSSPRPGKPACRRSARGSPARSTTRSPRASPGSSPSSRPPSAASGRSGPSRSPARRWPRPGARCSTSPPAPSTARRCPRRWPAR